MKLSYLLLASSLLFGVAGCSSADAANEDAEDVDATSDDLTARAIVGSYEWSPDSTFVDFQDVKLKADGNYTAHVDSTLVNPGVMCIHFPCSLPESGKWETFKSGGKSK